MSVSELGSLGEFIGSIAVLITLIYLTLQIRQNTNAVQGSNEKQMTSETLDFVKQIVTDNELRDLWHRVATDQPMDADDRLRYLWLMAYWFTMCEGWYRLHQRGLVSEDAWKARLTDAIAYLQPPMVADWWDANAASLSKDFRLYVEKHRNDETLNWTMRDSAKLIDRLIAEDEIRSGSG